MTRRMRAWWASFALSALTRPGKPALAWDDADDLCAALNATLLPLGICVTRAEARWLLQRLNDPPPPPLLDHVS